MDKLEFSFIIPVYNRPNEIEELLQSFLELDGNLDFEIVIIEDGSSQKSNEIVKQFQSRLNIAYYFKPNSGPGDSRNYGMKKAKGNYFIILDSDVLLPSHYLEEVKYSLKTAFFHCYGGPDAAHSSFNALQKAINFSMTSFLTTGGIRGGKKKVNSFQPRSFNMGLSKTAFEATGGFGDIHPGEDPDLSLRLHKMGFKTTLLSNAFVYHKRRITWSKFYQQVHKFGLVRPILNSWHPKSKSLVFWFPTIFVFGLIIAVLLYAVEFPYLLYLYLGYLSLGLVWASIESRSIIVGVQAVIAILIQFFGYGYGFLKSTIAISFMKREPKAIFPHLFFK
ncbi:glycosyltransferase [Winogradskyella sp. DF17]|uniref:Glycosyltransferase n=1 Tax=Winogradskyella pelagia TaxID=2819984 RepID=A0ABS3T3P1_9FLAO|nr:glycosyltransferase [Winogradskyella sp. DF17]MBO3117363.1 glycosyltransferase [Winogradskyella sp. DF17]